MPESSSPQVTITVTKPTSAQGSLVFTTYIEEGTFSIENVSLFDEIVDASKETAEGQFRQDAAYGGPSEYRLCTHVEWCERGKEVVEGSG